MSKAVKPIPEQYHSVTPNLICRNAESAISFYRNAFGATEMLRMPGPDGRIMHAEIKIGDSIIFVSDPMGPGTTNTENANGHPVSLHLYVTDADSVFKRAVEAGARAEMPLEDMFWGDRYGRLVDPYGHMWGIATHKEDVSLEEMGRRQKAFFAKMAAARS